MPLPTLPPTPAASTDITGKEAIGLSAAVQAFNLPSPALQPQRRSSTTTRAPHLRPIQPATNTPCHLPPPPARARPIIQMTPSIAASTRSPTAVSRENGRRPKQGSSKSAAGKKTARKTAHSVIERRRRSKMNEEFATLKNMIPACADSSMHKLAILQASVDYLRYLENCIRLLKASNDVLSTPEIHAQAPRLRLDDGYEMDDVDDRSGDESDGQPEDDEFEAIDSEMPDLTRVTSIDECNGNTVLHLEGTEHKSLTKSARKVSSTPDHKMAATPLLRRHSPCSNMSSSAGQASPARVAAQDRARDSSHDMQSDLASILSPSTKYTKPQRRKTSELGGVTASSAPSLDHHPAVAGKRSSSQDEDEEVSAAALLMLNKDRRYSKEALLASNIAESHQSSTEAQSIRLQHPVMESQQQSYASHKQWALHSDMTIEMMDHDAGRAQQMRGDNDSWAITRERMIRRALSVRDLLTH